MPANPFYPGYKPSKSNEVPSNPGYPGYYPGRKTPPRPRPQGKMQPIGSFGSGEALDYYLGSIEKEIEQNIPDKWVRKRLEDDFDKAFDIRVKPPAYVPTEALDDFETATLPGGGYVTINADPRQWKKQGFKKMMKKTLTSWAVSALEFGDYETEARTVLWKSVIYDESPYAAADIGIDSMVGKSQQTSERNPFSFVNRGIYVGNDGKVTNAPQTVGERMSAVDVYEKAGGKLVNFYRNSQSAILRDKSYFDFLDSAIGAVALETNWRYSSLENEPSEEREIPPDTKSVLLPETPPDQSSKTPSETPRTTKITGDIDRELGVFTTGAPGKTNSILQFKQRYDITHGMGDVASRKLSAVETLTRNVTAGLNEGNLSESVGTIIGLRSTVSDELEKLNKLRTGPGNSFCFDSKTNRILEKYANNLTRMDTVLNSDTARRIAAGTLTQAGLSTDMMDLIRELNTSQGIGRILAGIDIDGGDIIASGLRRQLLIHLEKELENPDSDIHKYIVENNLNGTVVLNHLQRASGERQLGIIEEGIFQLEKSGLFEAYGWTPRIMKALSTAPSVLSRKYWVQKGLAYVENFGLTLNDKRLKQRGLKWDTNDEVNSLFGNKFSMKIDIGGKSYRVKMWGGEHFAAIGNSQHAGVIDDWYRWGIFGNPTADTKDKKAIRAEKSRMAAEYLANGKRLIVSSVALDGSKKLIRENLRIDKEDLANGKIKWTVLVKDKETGAFVSVVSDDFKHLATDLFDGCKTEEDVFNTLQKLMQQQESIAGLKDYFIKNVFSKMGLDEKDQAAWASLLDGTFGMREKFIDLERRYIGLLDRVSSVITKFQNWALAHSKVLRWAASTVNKIKTKIRSKLLSGIKNIPTSWEAAFSALGTKVESFLSKNAAKLGLKKLGDLAARKAISTALASIGATLGNFLGVLLAIAADWLLKKIEKFIKNVIGTTVKFFRGELDQILAQVEADLDKKTRKLVIAGLIIFLFFTFIESIIGSMIPILGNIPSILRPAGILTEDPFSDGIPFALSTFSPADHTRKYGTMDQYYDWNFYLGADAEGLPGAGGYVGPLDRGLPGPGGPINCGDEKTLPEIVTYTDPIERAITSHAYEIAQDLEPGFWCAFNHSVSIYPDLWDQSLYEQDPMMEYDNNDGSITHSLFWCTWMVIKTQQRSYSWFQDITGTYTMQDWLRNSSPYNTTYRMVGRQDAPISEIRPGSIIFYGHTSGVFPGTTVSHVGIVYSKEGQDGIYTIESNSGDVSYFLETECANNCAISDARGYQHVLGFGIPH